jgi:ABC-2 type transport system ATP-binding protein
MTTQDAIVTVRDLRKAYGTLVAVDAVNFDINRGETLALLGPNGAGKSTTIEILEGYRDRSSGDVRVLGIDPQHGGLNWKAQLGIVLQSTGEPGTATVREQLTHFAGFYPHPRSVDEVIEAVGLANKATSRIRSLSGGQRRRVDVALGIIGRPQLLFLDEPTTGFDPEARHEFWDLIRSLKQEGTTILLTTHYLDEAAQLSDRAAIIAGGRLVEIAPIDEIGGADARVPVVRWREAGTWREERTSEPGTFVARLHATLGTEPDSLEVIRPSLEDIYLGIVNTRAAASPAAPPRPSPSPTASPPPSAPLWSLPARQNDHKGALGESGDGAATTQDAATTTKHEEPVA